MTKIKVEYDGNGITIRRPGKCAICPSTWGLTKHHVFGRGHPVIMKICANCHNEFNNEVNNRQAGTFTRHIIAIMAAVWPITAQIPDWKPESKG